MTSLFHGGSSSVAALKAFNEKPYFPTKPSFFKNPSFCFQHFSQKAHLSFSRTTANRPKPIGKTTTWCCNGGEGECIEEEEEDYHYGGDHTRIYGRAEDGYYEVVSEAGMKLDSLNSTLRFKLEFMKLLGLIWYDSDWVLDGWPSFQVALNVNNIITYGATPSTLSLMYSDWIPDIGLLEKILKGVEDGCKQSDSVFKGVVDFFDSNCFEEYGEDYGIDAHAVGRVRLDSAIQGENIVAGDVLIGLPSSGVHCSGFSLVNRVLAQSGLSLKDQLPGGSGKPITLGEALMVPTVIYVKQVLDIISKGGVKGIAHITDGGFMRSLLRPFKNCLGLGATIYKDAWEVPAVFKLIQEAGRIEDAEMRRTFNMGIGMVLVVSPDAVARILGEQHGGFSAYRIGEVTSGEGVTYQ